MNYTLVIAYDGTGFLGWQTSKDGPTIELMLKDSIEKILQHKIKLQAASRTDKGVHAQGQVVNFMSPKQLNKQKLLISLNQILPPSIRVLEVFLSSLSFHPTINAISKHYLYCLYLSPVHCPFARTTSWHIYKPLEVNLIKKGIPFFLGTKNFSAFSNNCKHPSDNKICTLLDIKLTRPSDNVVHFEVIGNRFLYKMVRNIIGTLVYIGLEKIALKDLPTLIQNNDRTLLGATAPARGLTLLKVNY